MNEQIQSIAKEWVATEKVHKPAPGETHGTFLPFICGRINYIFPDWKWEDGCALIHEIGRQLGITFKEHEVEDYHTAFLSNVAKRAQGQAPAADGLRTDTASAKADDEDTDGALAKTREPSKDAPNMFLVSRVLSLEFPLIPLSQTGIPITASAILKPFFQNDQLCIVPDATHQLGKLSVWDARLGAFTGIDSAEQFVPTPLVNVVWKQDGGAISKKAENFGARKILLLECDHHDQAEQLCLISAVKYLFPRLPLLLVLHSGNKSLHAWVLVDGLAKCQLDGFKKFCIALGFCSRSIKSNTHQVRVPNGCRNNADSFGQVTNVIQKVLYVNREIITNGPHRLDPGVNYCSDVKTLIPDLDVLLKKTINSLMDTAPVILDRLAITAEDSQAVNLTSEELMKRAGIHVLCAPTGVGKSTLLTQMALRLSNGEDFLGILKPYSPIKTLYLSYELDKFSMSEMIQSVVAAEGRPSNYYDPTRLRVACVFRKPMDQCKAELTKMMCAFQPNLVIIDPLNGAFDGDICHQEQVGSFLRGILMPLSEAFPAAILIAHHTNRQSGDMHIRKSFEGAYAGSGSAEIANVPCTILTLEPRVPDRSKLADEEEVYYLCVKKARCRSGHKFDAETPLKRCCANNGKKWVKLVASESNPTNSILDDTIKSHILKTVAASPGIGKEALKKAVTSAIHVDVNRHTRIVDSMITAGSLIERADANSRGRKCLHLPEVPQVTETVSLTTTMVSDTGI